MNQNTKILVIDDEKSIRRFLELSLEAQQYSVLLASTGQDGIQFCKDYHPDVVILDLGLPDLSGLAVLTQIRMISSVPVIILTVQNSDQEKETLLDAGADDYLTKPFSMTELLARIRVALRHSVNLKETTIYQNGALKIDFNTRTVTIDQAPIKLTKTEFDLLKILVKYAGKLVTQNQLLKEVWGTYAYEHSHYLRIYISQLRRKLEIQSNMQNLIITEQGVGYRLDVA